MSNTKNFKEYRAEAIANFILNLAADEKIEIDHLKLQKLLYISFGCCTFFLNRYIFKDPIEAWKYGPVVPSIYYEFQECGRHPIPHTKRAYIFDFFGDEEAKIAEIDPADENLKSCMEAVFSTYKHTESSKLISMTHTKGTPWYSYYDGTPHKKIPREAIKEYYKNLLAPL